MAVAREETVKDVYLDYQATTPMGEGPQRACSEALRDAWGNPSSGHHAGRKAKEVVTRARQQVADMLNAARPEDIIFTSGGTEGNNLVLYTATRLAGETAPAQPRVHIVSTTVEHDSVENMLQHLEATGWAEVTRVAPRGHGQGGLQVDDIVAALRPETTLVTVMLANNETGTIFPVGEIASAVKVWAGERAQQILVHTDAAQGIGKIPVDVQGNLKDVDFLTVVGHKFYGPRTGALFARNIGLESGVPLRPFLFGGKQERDFRPGTENVGMIAALGQACQEVTENLSGMAHEMLRKRQHLEDTLSKTFGEDRVRFNGVDSAASPRLPNTVNFSLLQTPASGRKYLQRMPHVHASVGSACHSHRCDSPSLVLLAFGVPEAQARSAMRWSVGRETTMEDINLAVASLKRADDELRA